jgi:hypothetical protein
MPNTVRAIPDDPRPDGAYDRGGVAGLIHPLMPLMVRDVPDARSRTCLRALEEHHPGFWIHDAGYILSEEKVDLRGANVRADIGRHMRKLVSYVVSPRDIENHQPPAIA